MSSYPSFKRRIYGPRCQSPPTFVCYELPQPESYTRSSSPTSSDDGGSDDECDDSGSESNSNSNEDEDGRRSLDSHNAAPVERMTMEGLPPSTGDDDNRNTVVVVDDKPGAKSANTAPEPQDIPCPPSGNEEESEDAAEKMRAEKREGKKKEIVVSDVDVPQKADVHVEDVNTPAKRRTKKKRSRRHREDDCAPAYRPILTIRASQGFVWNQDLFVPSYIKERYIASSPPSSSYSPMRNGSPGSKSHLVNNNFFSSSNEMDYEVECVEIHVDEDELDSMVPRA